MKILQSGLPKSGNLWLYRILQLCAAEAGWPRSSFIRDHPIQQQAKDWDLSFPGQATIDVLDFRHGQAYCRISSRFRERVRDFDDYLARTSHVWTHSPLTLAERPLLARFDSIVYIIRDPRDAAVSMSRFVLTPYMQAHYPRRELPPESYLDRYLSRIVKTWVRHVGQSLLQRHDLRLGFVFYERLLDDLDGELARLLALLDLDLDAAARARIKAGVQFESMQPSSPGHLRAGRRGAWRQALSDGQRAAAAKAAGPLLCWLGYPADADAEAELPLPALPAQLDDAALRRALAHAQPGVEEQLRNAVGRLRRKVYRAATLAGRRAEKRADA
jgi:aryl sulfotransferase